MIRSVKWMFACIVDRISLLRSISSRHIICIFDAWSRSYFCGYLYDDNWFRSSNPFARSLQYISRYTSWTVFRSAIVILHRDLIFVKKAGRLWLIAVGRSTTSFLIRAFYSIYFINYNHVSLQPLQFLIFCWLKVVIIVHTSITAMPRRNNVSTSSWSVYQFVKIKLLTIVGLCNSLKPTAALINCSNLR